MNTAKIYYDINGNEKTICQMVKCEPHWAANRIQEGEKAIARLEALQSFPLHPTVDEWEKATGKKLKDDDAVWHIVDYGDYKCWVLTTWGLMEVCANHAIIVAIPGKGKPSADWRPK